MCGKFCQRQPEIEGSCTEQKSYFPRVLKGYFNEYVMFSLKYCASLWMSSSVSHLGLLASIVRSAKMLYESELCCLEHRRKVCVLCLL